MSANFLSISSNLLLATLPAAEWERVRRHFKPIFTPLDDVLYEPKMAVDHIYFPTTSVISVSCVMNDGRADALTLIGREGFAGVELSLGSGPAPCRAVVLSEGWAYRIKRNLLTEELDRSGLLRSMLLRYAQSYITQVAQTTVCNRHHSIDQQLSRWLLMFSDRLASNEVLLTHEHIAELMGVRRESVSEAAGKLQAAGYIRNRRGRISVVDRGGLEACACECYEIVKRETDRLLQMSRRITPRPMIPPAVDRVDTEGSKRIAAHAAPTFA